MSDNSCPICKESRFHSYKLGLVQCDVCGVVLSPSIWQPRMNEQMEENWFGEDFQSRKLFWVQLFEARNNRKTLRRLAHAGSPGKRLLEIGVGSGSFLTDARMNGYTVMGCDLSVPICEHIRNSYGFMMHNDSLETLEGEDRFDVIVMNHVLEHVQQPIEFMKDVSRLLTSGGIVHIAVPNIACWEAKFSGWTSFEPYHLSYFSPPTLERTISDSGLIIHHIKTYDSFSGWFLALLRTMLGINKSSGAVTRPPATARIQASRPRTGFVEHAYRLAMIAIGILLWPLRLLQARLGYGDEIVCIAGKGQSVFSSGNSVNG